MAAVPVRFIAASIAARPAGSIRPANPSRDQAPISTMSRSRTGTLVSNSDRCPRKAISDGTPPCQELAADQGQGSEDGFDKRRLAGAVMPDNSKYIASRQMKRHVADDCLPPITEGQLVRRQDHERCLSGQPVTVDAMMTHSMAQVALTPRSRLAVLSSVKLKPGLVRPAMALACICFSSRGHPPQMRISTCLAGILAHGHRVYVPAFPGFPSGVSDTPTAHSCGYSPGFAP